MASDLSTLIQDGLSSTLNGLLGKETKLIDTTKVHELDIKDLEVLQVNSIFDFDSLSSTLSFVIPAVSASYIFNTMMGDSEATTLTTIDDDTKDAIEEFISNLSGSLVTSINAAGLEDLGNVKFNITKSEVIKGDSLAPYENLFRFLLDLEGYQLVVFIQFDKVILPFIDNILKSEITKHEEPEPVIEEIEEIKEEMMKEEVKKEESAPEKTEPEATKDNTEAKEKLENSGDEAKEEEDPKQKKIRLAIYGVAGLLATTILALTVMYFMGVFDEPEPPKVDPKKKVKKVKKDEVDVVHYTTLKRINFKPSDIDANRLNARLAILSKNGVLTPQELAVEKKEEKQRLAKLNIEKQYLEFAKKNKEEPLTTDIIQKITKKDKIVAKTKQPAAPTKPQKYTYLVANSLQYKLFSSLISELKITTAATTSICGNDIGETVIYMGPFSNIKNLDNLQKMIGENDSNIELKIVSITKEEYSKACN